MNRFDRALAILLVLRSGKTVSAAELAKRLEVSVRTIYRDIETLSAVGVPVYAEIGRDGGFRLLKGYFLPPIAFTRGEATSLLTGLALLGRLRVKPFATELATSAQKLLAVVPPGPLHDILSQAHKMIGFETIPEDVFHPESSFPAKVTPSSTQYSSEGQTLTVFLQSLFDQRMVQIDYHSPYNGEPVTQEVIPGGILWDRDHWYLVGQSPYGAEGPRLWRVDRVNTLIPLAQPITTPPTFAIERVLDRRWLTKAMSNWANLAPVIIRMTQRQAERLKHDWYYGHAQYEPLAGDEVLMTFGESNRAFVFELLRWLGPGAELIEPQKWRSAFAEDLRAMLVRYGCSDGTQ